MRGARCHAGLWLCEAMRIGEAGGNRGGSPGRAGRRQPWPPSRPLWLPPSLLPVPLTRSRCAGGGAGAGGGRGARRRPGRAGGCAGRAGSGGPRGPRRRAAPGRLWRRGAGRGEGRAAEPRRDAQSQEGRSRDGTRRVLRSWAVPAEPRRATPRHAEPRHAAPRRAQHGPLALAVPAGRPGPGRQLPPPVQPLHRGGRPDQPRPSHGPAGPRRGPRRCPRRQPAQVGAVTTGPCREGNRWPGSTAVPCPGGTGGCRAQPPTTTPQRPAGHRHVPPPARGARRGAAGPLPVGAAVPVPATALGAAGSPDLTGGCKPPTHPSAGTGRAHVEGTGMGTRVGQPEGLGRGREPAWGSVCRDRCGRCRSCACRGDGVPRAQHGVPTHPIPIPARAGSRGADCARGSGIWGVRGCGRLRARLGVSLSPRPHQRRSSVAVGGELHRRGRHQRLPHPCPTAGPTAAPHSPRVPRWGGGTWLQAWGCLGRGGTWVRTPQPSPTARWRGTDMVEDLPAALGAQRGLPTGWGAQ